MDIIIAECKKNKIEMRINSEMNGIANISFKNIDSEPIQYILYQKYGYMISTASACHSNLDNPEPSYVLKEIDTPKEYLNGSLRISFSPDSKLFYTKDLAKKIIKLVKAQMNNKEI